MNKKNPLLYASFWLPPLMALFATSLMIIYLSKPSEELAPSSLAVILVTFGVVSLIPFWSSFLALVDSFAERHPRDAVVVICASYMSIAFSFACYFFAFIYIGDYNDAVGEYHWYKSEVLFVDIGSQDLIYPRPESEIARAFDGLAPRAWSGPWESISMHDKKKMPAPLDSDLRELVQEDLYNVVELQPGRLLRLGIDAVFCSLTNLVGVGSGPLTPRTGAAKIAVAVEALTGVALLVVALGMALSRFGMFMPELGKDNQ